MDTISNSSLFKRLANQSTSRAIKNGNTLNALSSGRRKDTSAINLANSLIMQAAASSTGANNGIQSIGRAEVASAALDSMGGMMQDLNTLAVRATDPTLTAGDRQVLQIEADQITGAMTDLVTNTRYNDQAVLQGDTYTTQVGDALTIRDADGAGVLSALGSLDLTSVAGAQAAAGQIRDASTALATEQTKVATTASALGNATQRAISRANSLEQTAVRTAGVDVALGVAQFVAQSVQSKVAMRTLASVHRMESDKIRALLE